jgi:hypothetical protein
MNTTTVACLLSVSTLLAGGAALGAGSTQDRTQQPGQPTQGRVWIQNRGSAEAVPVSIQNVPSESPMRVQIVGTPTVTAIAGSVVQTRTVRQVWEYRDLNLAGGQDAITALNGAGNDGWEAIGLVLSPSGGTTVLMKRPK